MTLLANYNHFISAWESTPETLRTVENLTARLIAEDRRMNTQENDQNIVFFSKSGQKDGSENMFLIGLEILLSASLNDNKVVVSRLWLLVAYV